MYQESSRQAGCALCKYNCFVVSALNVIHLTSTLFDRMGESGAGKTTLMDVIALRKRSGEISGDVLLNGFPQEPISFRRCSGYVEQFGELPKVLLIDLILSWLIRALSL